MSKKFTEEDAKLLEQLGVESQVGEVRTYTAVEERVLAGFEDIERFFEEHDRLPVHGADNDFFERRYAIRLDRILEQEECVELLSTVDKHGILARGQARRSSASVEDMNDRDLLEALGVEVRESDLTQLSHVRPVAGKKMAAADEVARRQPCEDFDRFKHVFASVQSEIAAGKRATIEYQDSANYKVGDMFIVGGQKALVSEMSEEFVTGYDRPDRRLRVIYDNGTEAPVLLRSLQRALNRDKTSRRILDRDIDRMPLFSAELLEGDVETGHIYVVRSLADHPYIAENRDLIHKIGMTKGDLKARLSGAKKDPTFLLAEVELVASYTLSNIDPKKLENLLHSFFADTRLDLKLQDRFGAHVSPREWFMLPLAVISQTVTVLMDGDLEHFRYDCQSAQLIDLRE